MALLLYFLFTFISLIMCMTCSCTKLNNTENLLVQGAYYNIKMAYPDKVFPDNMEFSTNHYNAPGPSHSDIVRLQNVKRHQLDL